MGCLTAKASGSIANFISPTVTPIESARVYFSPTQLGEGTPSPENVREIVGRTSVTISQSHRNLYGNTKNTIVPIYISANTKWTASSNGGATVIVYDINQNKIDSWALTSVDEASGRRYKTLRRSYDIYYVNITGTNASDVQFEIGDLTDYESVTTIPFSWKRLPDEYQEVEYISREINGAYITCGKNMNLNGCELYISASVSTESGERAIAGSNTTDTGLGGVWELYPSGSGFRIWSNASAGYKPTIVERTPFSLNTKFNVHISFAEGHNTGLVIGQYRSGAYQTDCNIYSCNVYKDNIKILDLIPCYRKSDNEIGMYDTVSQTFYTNQGTGTFTKGDDVFSDEVYGGYVDLVKGEIVETNVYDVLDAVNSESLNDYYNTNQTVFFRCATDYVFASLDGSHVANLRCENLQPSGMNWGSGDSQDSYVNTITRRYGSSQAVCIRMYNSVFDINADDTVGVKKQKINAWLVENPIHISYKLETPITHPLPDYLKTQLQTLKNENTFWSDADSVEIEYGLAETFDIQKAKQKIIMNQPHVETLTGDIVSFTTDMKAPLKECKVYFEPVQEGEGDPSPDNVRNISGWNGVSVKNGSNTYSVDWTDNVGTVYGGYVDLVKGELVVTYKKTIIDGSFNAGIFPWDTDRIDINTGKTITNALYLKRNTGDNKRNRNAIFYCNKLKTISNYKRNEIGCSMYDGDSYSVTLTLPKEDVGDTQETLKTYLNNNPIEVVFELAEPVTYQLTPQQLVALKGQNNLWANTNGTINVKYWKH